MNGSPLKIYGDHYVGSRNRKGDARGQCSVRYCGNADQRHERDNAEEWQSCD